MKKIIILVGSARNGNSLYLAERISRQYPAEVIKIASYKIENCTGCLDCDETKTCVFKDDMESLIQKVVDSDLVIAITPTRWGLLSGELKVFIDRLNPIATTEELVGKSFIGVSIGQSELGDSSIPHAVDSLAFFAESAGMNLLGSFPIYECLSGDDLSGKEDLVNQAVSKIIQLIG